MPINLAPYKCLFNEKIWNLLLENIENVSDLSNLSKTTIFLMKFLETKRIEKFIDYNFNATADITLDCCGFKENHVYSEPTNPRRNMNVISMKKSNNEKCIDTLYYKNQLSIILGIGELRLDMSKHDYNKLINNAFLDEVVCKIKMVEENTLKPEILNFNHSHAYINHIISPYIVSRYSNDSVKIIKFNMLSFVQHLNEEEKLKKVDIFRGYREFNELHLYKDISFTYKSECLNRNSLLIHILGCLSKRKKGILKIEISNDANGKLSFLSNIFNISNELNIQLKLSLSIGSEKRRFIEWHEKIRILKSDVSMCLTTLECLIQYNDELLNLLTLLPKLENLTYLKLLINEFIIDKSMLEKEIIEVNGMSLKELKNFKKFTLITKHDNGDFNKYTHHEIFSIQNKLIKLFTLLLPEGIKFLELENILFLTPETCGFINDSFENLEILFCKHVGFTNSKSLIMFEKIKFLKVINCPLIEIPENVELLVQKYYLSTKAPFYKGIDGNIEEENDRQDKKYGQYFTKKVIDSKRNFKYYFNHLHKWNYYKKFIEKVVF
uniref:F-box domain-containing protein n=1 Tax=Parastrongyloides trichosuri TaxID=131310 RepID=A0A0N4ZQH5_PARTI